MTDWRRYIGAVECQYYFFEFYGVIIVYLFLKQITKKIKEAGIILGKLTIKAPLTHTH